MNAPRSARQITEGSLQAPPVLFMTAVSDAELQPVLQVEPEVVQLH
ncbi:MAG: hypothetical protein KatS3mg022_3357 [Armatimonadota bacterium]|nr:MAG: hypothetical protein KatS3mg022_3357 [Armatimonadota bacterium]